LATFHRGHCISGVCRLRRIGDAAKHKDPDGGDYRALLLGSKLVETDYIDTRKRRVAKLKGRGPSQAALKNIEDFGFVLSIR
jgi:hypothetical protein